MRRERDGKMTNLTYLAVVKRKIESLLKSCPEIMEVVVQEVESFEEMVNRMLWGRRRRWNKEIRLAIDKLKDAIQSHLPKQRTGRSGTFAEVVKLELHSFTETMRKMEKELVDELYQSLAEAGNEDDVDSSKTLCSEMIGLSDQYSELKTKLTGEGAKVKVLCIVGMAGVGKTALARKIYEDGDVCEHFDLRVWVRAGRRCQHKEILRRIAAQLDSDADGMPPEAYSDQVVGFLREKLKDKKYLIVLDDVWGKYVKYYLECRYEKNEMRNPFPDRGDGSRVLLTTRLQQVDERHVAFHQDLAMRLMNKEESWDLLRVKVFGEGPCPFSLERFGVQIAEKCDGLPLTILTIAKLLGEGEKSREDWREIAQHKNHQIFFKAYDQISKVLLPNYRYLPPVLQMCFLYMGVFPRACCISRSKLINMWKTDGFLELNAHGEVEYVDELVINNLAMIHQRTRDASLFGGIPIVKTCRLHSSWWHLSKEEGGKAKFFHVLDSVCDGFGHGIEGQRRLSFHNNVLFGIKEMCESVEESCASTAHSLLCYGTYHKYQVPLCYGLRLLKKLDALTIRLYEFPVEVTQLYELRYLTLTLDGNIPAAISLLSKLRFLIVNRHVSIKSCSDPSYLPREIWDMKQLQHLQVMGSDLPKPCDASLERLSTLSDVSGHSCAKGILVATPQLSKLGIRMELELDGISPLSCLDHVSLLPKLRSLKCVVVNPDLAIAPAQLPILPSHLQKLSLSGTGYSWEETAKIASLPNLHMLKLKNYAFQGPLWEVGEDKFFSLVMLVIEDTDLVEWKLGHGSFQGLGRLIIRHCYHLERIAGEFDYYLEDIEVDDCGPMGESCAEEIRKDRIKKKDVMPEPNPNVDVRSSWR